MAKDPFGAIYNGNAKQLKRSMPLETITIRRRNSRNGRSPSVRYVKVRLDGPLAHRWKLFARWWWEKNRGPIPPGHIIFHKDGNELNDSLENLVLGTPGEKIKATHTRDPEMSRNNHQIIGRMRGEMNRLAGRINRAKNFLKFYWYPVVDDLSVILNVPFRRRKRLLGGFGVNVRNYPLSGGGRHGNSEVQKAIAAAPVRPVPACELVWRRYTTYCLIEPVSRKCQGPVSMSVDRLITNLDRLGIWRYAEKQAKKDLKERK